MSTKQQSEIRDPQSEMTFSVLTWGCQMNEDDSRQIGNLLEQMGYHPTDDPADADIVMLNTCSVREKPEQKVRSKLGELRLVKKERPGMIIGVCGCMAQRDGLALRKSMPFIDIVIGTASIPELPMLVEQVRQKRRFVSSLALPERAGVQLQPEQAGKKRAGVQLQPEQTGKKRAGVQLQPEHSANPEHPTNNVGAGVVLQPPTTSQRVISEVELKMFVPVMFGCDNFCAYCVVPHVRGPERSRPAEEVVAEVTELVAKGCREVTLVGQNVNSYRGDAGSEGRGDAETDFAELLALVNDIDGLERIRFTTSHPKDLSDRLINAIAELPKVCEHLHLPIQSGDNEILRRMGRGYTIEHYIDLIDKLRTRVPGIAITTDVLIGFPGESGEQFQNTLDAIRAIRFDGAFMFAFNPRPGTAAAEMGGQLDHRTKMRRLVELIAIQNEITYERALEREGETFEVLAEGPSERDASRMTGYTRQNRTVNFRSPAKVAGKLVHVRAEKAHPWGFSGEIV